MQVTLIDYTQNAIDKLIYTKSTRLTLGEDTRAKIAAMSGEQKLKELEAMAQTIPSSWEFVTYTFEILKVSRAFTHQFVRTRTGSYAQQTMRVLDMEDWTYETGPTAENAITFEEGLAADDDNGSPLYHDVMRFIKSKYRQLISGGVAIEDARGILPTNIHTNIIAQFSLRQMSDFNRSRGGRRTQGEYRDVMDACREAVYGVHPWARLFIEPDTLAPVKVIEEILHSERTCMSKETLTALYKQLDLIRKSL